jgi:hypothetical protein
VAMSMPLKVEIFGGFLIFGVYVMFRFCSFLEFESG